MGKKFGDLTKTERIEALKQHLFTYGSIGLQFMLDEFRISRKTALRDIEELHNQNIGTVEEELADGDRRYSISLSSRRIPLSFTMEQVMALFLGRQMFDFLEGTSFSESFHALFAQMSQRLNKKTDIDNIERLQRKLYNIHEAPKRFSGVIPDILEMCMVGLRHDRAIDMTYRNYKGDVTDFIFHPYTLITFRRGLYFIGAIDGNESVIRKIALERIQRAALTGIAVLPPEDYTPEDYLSSALFFDTGAPQRVELRFVPGADAFIGLRVFHPSQQMQHNADDTITLPLAVHPGYEVLHWIMSFGANVTVVRPASLVEQTKAELAKTLANYSS